MTEKQPDLEKLAKILSALRSFSFSNFGCDDIDEIMRDPDLDLLDSLAYHIYSNLEDGELNEDLH
jgi:hypothetical protein